MKWSSTLLIVLLLAGCQQQQSNYAPVIDGWRQSVDKQGAHNVQKGETLYSIAWRYGFDHREVARLNGISEPYTIQVGQKLYLVENEKTKNAQKHKKPLVAQKNDNIKKNLKNSRTKSTYVLSDKARIQKQQAGPVTRWYWPTKGQVIDKYSNSPMGNKGIDIAGQMGQTIRAAAAGEVVYSGDGLRAYGNMIIIKHNANFLSAYAHNKQNLVREGTWVKANQPIAKMGDTGAKRVNLRFEIRRSGKPVDPLAYVKPSGK